MRLCLFMIHTFCIVEIVVCCTLEEKVIRLVNEEKEAESYFLELNATILPSSRYFYSDKLHNNDIVFKRPDTLKKLR